MDKLKKELDKLFYNLGFNNECEHENCFEIKDLIALEKSVREAIDSWNKRVEQPEEFKVGESFYYIKKYYNFAKGIDVYKIHKGVMNITKDNDITEIFKTKEQAEQALKELEANNG